MSTTLVLQPDDYTNITFDAVLPVGGPESGAVTAFQIELSSLRFYEEQRVAVEYAAYQYREGGEVGSTSYPLVPVEFTCRVNGLTGATIAAQLADLLAKSSQLKRAIYNSDGYFMYKPDGLAAGVLDTYYRYLRSVPPAPTSGEKSYWGMIAATSEPGYEDGIPYRVFTVRLMTMPVATSDPTSPVSVLSATTLNNIGDGTNDYVTITNATVKGDMPALTRIVAHPLTAGTSAAIGTLWLARRTTGLASFVATYLTSTANVPTAAWSTVVDASRCGGSYYRCTPAANQVVYSRRYTISNWTSHRGRAAILAVVRNNGGNDTDFEFYYRWAISDVPLTGPDQNTTIVGYWQAVLLGEIDLPETEMSGQEDIDLYIDVCVVRKAGSGTFDLDAVKLLFTDEAALQADTPTGYGVSNSQSYLLENFVNEEIAHVINHSTNKLDHICGLFGDLLLLRPDTDNRLDVAWNRYNWGIFADDFSGYGSLWEKIADMESDEDWTGGRGLDDTYYVEGVSMLYTDAVDPSRLVLGAALDLSPFSSSDYVTLAVYKTGATTDSLVLRLYSEIGPPGSFYQKTFTNITTGWHFLKESKTNFTAIGAPDWAGIVQVYILPTYAHLSQHLYVDDLRFSTVDPDDPTTHNDTGEVWDFPSGEWHVYELDSTDKSLGQIDVESNVEKTALIHTNYGPDVRYRAKVKTLRDSGYVGLVFRVSDGTEGSEDLYAFLIDTSSSSSNVALRSYSGGASSNVATPVSKAVSSDVWYYMGVLVNSTSIQCFVSGGLDMLWDTSNRVFNVTDGTHTAGQCGLMTLNAIGRFTDVRLEPANDLHIPAEQLQLSAYALFRTIYPFGES